MALIILNMVAVVIDTVQSIRVQWHHELYIFELISVVIFTLEYLMRLYVSDLTHPAKTRAGSVLRFMGSTYGIIDLCAILPFYIPLLFHIDAESLSLLLLLRFARIFKINRYNNSTNLILSVIKEKRSQLATTFFVAFILLVISSVLMYHVEGKVQPDNFPNIVAAFWWAISTLTTVGYGDVVPVTGLGKLISGLLAFLGLGIVALPTGIISSGFLEKSRDKSESRFCPHCGEEIDPHLHG